MELKVMTYNIRRLGWEQDEANLWEHRKSALLSLINKHSPDILCVQEDKPEQTEEIIDLLKGYGHYGHGTEDDPAVHSESNTIFYCNNFNILSEKHYWLTNTPLEKSKFEGQSKFHRVLTCVELESKGRKISVYNTHFDHLSGEIRAKQASVLAEIVNNPEKYVICGDFNDAAESEAIQILKNKFTLIDPEIEGPSWADWTGVRHAVCIDFIFSNLKSHGLVMDKSTYLGIDCRQRTPSDHYPLVARLEF